MQAKIIEIGPKAVNEEKILIFFDETATDLVREYCVIQKFEEDVFEALKSGDKMRFGQQEYTISSVGSNVLEQLKEMGHVSFFFGQAPDEELINAITLAEDELPEISVGMTLVYGE